MPDGAVRVTLPVGDSMRTTAWLRAVRIPFLTATVVPIVLGAVVAWHDTGVFVWARFWTTMAGALLIHAGTNLFNEYADHVSGNDAANVTPTPFSGGSRVIQEGLIRPRAILSAAIALLVLGGSVGVYLNLATAGNVILVLGAVGIFLGYSYNAPPLRLGYRGLGEPAVGIGFGPLLVAGAYYVQAESLSPRVFLISLPIGVLIALVLLINGFPDYVADRSVGKKTLVVLLGRSRAVVLYHALLAAVYVLLGILFLLRVLPPACLVVFASLPLAWRAYAVSRRSHHTVRELLPANAATIGIHALAGGLLSAGFVLDRIV